MRLELDNLKESNDFLNTVFDNITSAVFIVDKDVKIRSVNDSCKILFNKKAENILGELCGNAMGCIYVAITHEKCGTTPSCNNCLLRKSVLQAFMEHVPSTKMVLEREFVIGNEVMDKIYQYTTRHIVFQGEAMVLIIVDDITESEKHKKKLKEQYERIEQLNNEIYKELEVAVKVQRKIMPHKNIEYPWGEIAVAYRPYRKVSGDYYDVINVEEDKIVVFLADVTGHGISAALYTTLLKDQLVNAVKESCEPSKILENINRNLGAMLADGFYIPAIAILIDLTKKEVVCANSASPFPIIKRKNELSEIESKGILLGIFDDSVYEEKRTEIKSGDEIYIYTDGILCVEGKENGITNVPKELILKAFSQNLNGKSENMVNGAIQLIEREYPGEEFNDDITVLGIKIY